MCFEHNVDSKLGFPHGFNFDSKFIKINGHNMHYVEGGKGNPIVFLHGVPTSSYVWRNIIPQLQPISRCIAPDLIGFGLSDKANIQYSIFEHIDYINKFISKLNLKNITFVLHGWGSVLGFNYACNFPSNTKAVAFYEAHIHPKTDWNQLSLPVQQLASFIRNQEQIKKAIIQDNYFMKKIFPASILHLPSERVMKKYDEPFLQPEHRQPLLQYIYDLPLGKNITDVMKLIHKYSTSLKKSSIPKLMLYSVPGFITPIETVKWCRDNLLNLDLFDLGEELHLAQESMPTLFGQILYKWFVKINKVIMLRT